MNNSWHTYWRGLACGARTGLGYNLVLVLLTPLARLYALVLRLRAWLYKRGILKSYRLPCPVVSIGNITVGGTGKTPVTTLIARYLLKRGYRVAVLSRGYGGTLEGQTCVVSDGATIMLSARECGDEPYLLASTIPGVMVVIGTDRYAAGLMAMQQLQPDIFLLDDGFQHLRLQRDLNILLLDFARPFGNGWTLPAGLLRESSAAARRADMVIFTRAPQGASLAADAQGIAACVSHHTLVDLLPLSGGSPVLFSGYCDKKVLAFAGIADPGSFFTALQGSGLNLVQTIPFPDHVVYTQERCQELLQAMRASGADVMVTTEKDGVKLTGLSADSASRTLLARMELTIDNPARLEQMLANLVQHHKA